MIRSVATLIATLALLLVLGQGHVTYAAGMGSEMGAVLSAHQDADGCAPAMMLHGRTEKHHAGGCAKMSCCMGTICVFAGLPATAIAVVPTSGMVLNLFAATAALTGRDVAPPLDPPRPFA